MKNFYINLVRKDDFRTVSLISVLLIIVLYLNSITFGNWFEDFIDVKYIFIFVVFGDSLSRIQNMMQNKTEVLYKKLPISDFEVFSKLLLKIFTFPFLIIIIFTSGSFLRGIPLKSGLLLVYSFLTVLLFSILLYHEIIKIHRNYGIFDLKFMILILLFIALSLAFLFSSILIQFDFYYVFLVILYYLLAVIINWLVFNHSGV